MRFQNIAWIFAQPPTRQRLKNGVPRPSAKRPLGQPIQRAVHLADLAVTEPE
jgi:hypothetical protein